MLFPAKAGQGCAMSDVSDGASGTMMLAETIEPVYARWMIGTEVTLATLPGGSPNDAGDPGAVTITGFWTGQAAGAAGTGNPNYYAPTGFDGVNFPRNSTVPSTYLTFLGYQYPSQTYGGRNPADGSTSGSAGAGHIVYGPSSRHPGVVNHLSADGAVHAIQTDVDVAIYMFLTTKAGGDMNPIGIL